jgi:prepilin-type N-terminal cleavage/methylation domain-containing protein
MPRAGFTIIEIVITVAVLSGVALAVGSFTTDIFKTTRFINTTLTAQDQARRTVSALIAELRTASISSLGAYPIAEASASNLTFYSNIDHDAYKERLRYFTSGGTLKRGVLKPNGNPLTYNPANETITDVVKYLINPSSIFSYFNDSYNGQGAPMSFPVNIPDIRLIRISLQIDQNVNEPPGAYELTSEVNIRNLKDNL